MWLVLSIFEIAMVSSIAVPYGYNNYNTNAQVYHPQMFATAKQLSYANNANKISHTLPSVAAVNKQYGLMQHVTLPPISNAQNYYSFAPAPLYPTQIPFTTTQAPRQYYTNNPATIRPNYIAPSVTPRINYQRPSLVTRATPTIKLRRAPKNHHNNHHNDLEYQNTHKYERHAYNDNNEDDDGEDDGQYRQNYQEDVNQKQSAHGNDPRDPKLKKAEPKLPERKDRIDFQVYGFDGPKSYKFGYDTGKG